MAYRYAASVVIPARDEEAVIGGLLDALLGGGRRPLEVVVVCNGCTDRTAEVAAAHPGRPRVVQTRTASKHEALRLGDEAVRVFPRLYVDADVVLSAAAALRVAAAVAGPAARVAAPRRRMDLTGSSRAVRLYYALWERLPAVRDGLYGRGVVAVNAAGWQRLRDRPPVLADDLFAHAAFAPGERVIVAGAESVVRGPRTVFDLVRRRARVRVANRELTGVRDRTGLPAPTTAAQVISAAARRPRLLPAVPVYFVISAWIRAAARRQRRRDPSAWLRDDSRRAVRPAPPARS